MAAQDLGGGGIWAAQTAGDEVATIVSRSAATQLSPLGPPNKPPCGRKAASKMRPFLPLPSNMAAIERSSSPHMLRTTEEKVESG